MRRLSSIKRLPSIGRLPSIRHQRRQQARQVQMAAHRRPQAQPRRSSSHFRKTNCHPNTYTWNADQTADTTAFGKARNPSLATMRALPCLIS